jgi:hypothetical protein
LFFTVVASFSSSWPTGTFFAPIRCGRSANSSGSRTSTTTRLAVDQLHGTLGRERSAARPRNQRPPAWLPELSAIRISIQFAVTKFDQFHGGSLNGKPDRRF